MDFNPPPFTDRHGRPLRSLRMSVTDRCNLRCVYCMPEKVYSWLPRADILTFEEIVRLVGLFVQAGVQRVRLTGGEPLLRPELPRLVESLASIVELRDLAMTTNGVRLAESAAELRHAGLQRLNISLDTLRPDRFQALTRRDHLQEVIAGIDAAWDAGFRGTKIDTVVMRERNADEILDLLAFAKERDLQLRFIEYMDVGGATRWSAGEVVSRTEILETVATAHGEVEALKPLAPSAPARLYRLRNGQVFGIIASTTTPFCGECDRSRIAADGTWFSCLYARGGVSIRELLRNGGDDDAVGEALAELWKGREERGAEERLEVGDRGPAVDPDELRSDPGREMHTRGG